MDASHDLPLASRVRALCESMGFQSCAFIPAARYDEADVRLQSWLDQGYHGEMAYMENHRALRVDARELHPGTRTIIALSVPYTPITWEDGQARVASYALGEDYHPVLRSLLLDLASSLEALVGGPINARPVVDSAPLLERETARRAGLGWVGRSAMLVHPRHGTFTLLCALLVGLDIEEEPTPQPDRCGRCTRCVDGCPTGAIVGDRVVDGSRCISYLTIELKGAIPRELRAPMGAHIFGCDICQAVCPWNRFAGETTIEALRPRDRPFPDAREILLLDNAGFRAHFKGTPMERSRRRGLARNAAVVLGNLRRPGDFEALQTALQTHDQPLVRQHAAWALGQWHTPPQTDERERALQALLHALLAEEDADVREEIQHALTQYNH